jgi:hypothetical protein
MERALIPRVGLSRCFSLTKELRKEKQSEISGRDFQKPFWELRNRNSLLHDKY